MPPVIPLANLVVKVTEAGFLKFALGIAQMIGLPVSSWQPGDPTRSAYLLEAKSLGAQEALARNFIASGFLDYITELAKEDADAKIWLRVIAKQQFNVDVPEASPATTTYVLTNTAAGEFAFDAGDITVRSSLTDKTYHSTSGGHLSASGTLTIDIEADEPGSDSSAGVGEIDELVTTFLGVTGTNPTAAIGADEQEPDITRQQCRDKLGLLGDDPGPTAWTFVARDPTLTGTSAVTDARVFADSETGDVRLVLRGPSGAVAEVDRALVEVAVIRKCLGLCLTPHIVSSVNVIVSPTYDLWLYDTLKKTTAQVQAAVLARVLRLFRTHPIGGDRLEPAATTGKLYIEKLEAVIASAFPDYTFRVSVSAPTTDPTLAEEEVIALGTLTGTIHFVSAS